MGDIKEFAIFTLKVGVAMLIINQIGAVKSIVNKSYFGS